MKVYSNDPGRVTEIAAMPIYGKTALKMFSENSRPTTFELGIQHQLFSPYKVCSKSDPGLTLTYFTARSK